MALLAEYAITPDVFDLTSYSSEEVCGLHLNAIHPVMMDEGVVRNLRDGEWRGIFADRVRPWHRRTKEILTKLAVQGRLNGFPAELPAAPTDDRAWCAEALSGHRQKPLTGGIIVTRAIKDAFRRERVIERIDQLAKAPWWTGRGPSVRLKRNLADYRRQLEPILRCANSLQFIDPHLHPERRGYRKFANLLADAGQRKPAPLIEIHRVCYVGSGNKRQFPNFEPVFRNALTATLHNAGLRAKVFIWDEFHDRYLLSNLMGILVPYGFDTTNADDLTTWTRLGRTDCDDVQREFEEGSGRHKLHAKFTVE